MTLPVARKWFQKYVKDNFNIDIPIDAIDLSYGEAGDG